MSKDNQLGNLLKQAQQMQAQMQTAQQELSRMTITGEAGGGLVKIEMDGRYMVKRWILDPAIRNEDLGVQEDLYRSAVNDAVRKVEEASRKKLSELTANIQTDWDTH